MKTCTKCNTEKPRDDYYAHPKTSDGRMSKCKDCHKSAVRHRARTNPYVQEYDRARAKLPHRLAQNSMICKRWRAANPDGYKAHTAVNNAIRDGRMTKGVCKVCGTNENLHAHHHDYKKPFDVEWLCALHHHRHHHE